MLPPHFICVDIYGGTKARPTKISKVFPFGSNLGLTIFEIIFVRIPVRKREIAFALFLTIKSGFFRKNAHFQ